MSHTYNISLASLKNSLKKQPDKLPMFERTSASISKFRAGNKTFYYDNFTNGIYNEDMIPMSEVTEPDAVYESVISEVRSRVKSDKPYWIRILLGHACN